jgi:hypothetical protein
MTPTFLRLVALAGSALALATPLHAQPAPADLPPPSQLPHPPPTAADQSDRLRQALSLGPNQEGALQAFIAALQPKPGQAERFRAQAQADASLPTPQRLDHIVARFEELRLDLLARVQATRTFYGALTPDQQRRFDALPSPAAAPR